MNLYLTSQSKPSFVSADSNSITPTLLFIPDISGFTRFVNDTEIEHSKHIVEELLERIIDANEIGLTISEIEGDAILFYIHGDAPGIDALLAQIRKMYIAFHGHVKKYDTQRICQCGACSSARGLQLKFVVHYGNTATKRVKQFSKLFGKDVILAHRLLKNSVSLSEYALLSHDLLDACNIEGVLDNYAWDQTVTGEDTYEAGVSKYCYLPMDSLRELVPEPRIEDYGVYDANFKVSDLEIEIGAPINIVFDAVSDLAFRPHWTPGLKASEDLSSPIANEGAAHRCVLDSSQPDQFYHSHGFKIGREKITWVESEQKLRINSVFTLTRLSPEMTALRFTATARANPLKALLFRMFIKPKFEKNGKAALQDLRGYCEDLSRTGGMHPVHVVLYPDDTKVDVPASGHPPA